MKNAARFGLRLEAKNLRRNEYELVTMATLRWALSYLTVPSLSAKSVQSRPMPMFLPAWSLLPR